MHQLLAGALLALEQPINFGSRGMGMDDGLSALLAVRGEHQGSSCSTITKCRRCCDWRTGQEFLGGHLWCVRCETELGALRKHPLYHGTMPEFFKRMLSGLRGAMRRAQRPEPSVQAIELLEAYLRQDGRCALTGWELVAKSNAGTLQATPLRCRAGHFTARNTVLVAQVIARAADSGTSEEFKRLAEAIVNHTQTAREMELLASIERADA